MRKMPGLLNKIKDLLKEPELRNIRDLDTPSATLLHRRIIRKKTFLKKIYLDFYRQLTSSCAEQTGIWIELGSGGGFLKEKAPKVFTTDILDLPNVDMRLSGTALPFRDASLERIIMIDVFHHLNDCGTFLEEAQRCLKPGAELVMVEPAATPLAYFIYTYLHHEGFDKKSDWRLNDAGPMSGANGALPWIVFVRDRKLTLKKFPRLKILSMYIHTPFRYLLSGGVSMRTLVPEFLYGPVRLLELALGPLNRLCGMFYTIRIIKE